MRPFLTVTVAASALALTASCGSEPADGLAAESSPACVSSERQAASANGSLDTRKPAPGAGYTAASYEFPVGDPEVLIRRLLPGIAVVTVEARDEAIAVTGVENLAGAALPRVTELRLAAPGTRKFNVVRPATLRVDRVIRGKLPNCLTVDVPGGSTGTFVDVAGANFPDTFKVGDRFFATFSPAGSPPGIGQLLPVAEDGTVDLPFYSPTSVNVDKWTPPAYEGIMR